MHSGPFHGPKYPGYFLPLVQEQGFGSVLRGCIGVRSEGGRLSRLSRLIQANFGRDELPSRGRLPGGLETVEQDRGERFEQPSQALIGQPWPVARCLLRACLVASLRLDGNPPSFWTRSTAGPAAFEDVRRFVGVGVRPSGPQEVDALGE